MRIAMVSEEAGPLADPDEDDLGGRHVHVAELSAALAVDHDVTIYARRDSPDLPEAAEAADLRVVPVTAGPARPLAEEARLPHLGRFAGELAAAWDAAPPDVVHAHSWMSGLAALLAARRLALPVVQTFHDLGVVVRRVEGDEGAGGPRRRRLERTIACSVDRVTAMCTSEAVELVRMGVPRSSVTVLPCGVDVDRFTPTGPAARRGSRFRVVCTGGPEPRHGLDTVIRSLRLLPEAELVIIEDTARDGDARRDADAARLRAVAEQLGVADRVHWAGPTPRRQLPALLRSADAVVCAGWYEASGATAVEAMACAIPVVVASAGGPVDTVVDGVTGLHVPPRDGRALAAALRGLVRDTSRRQSLGVAGSDRARARFSWARIAGDTARLYHGLVAAETPEEPLAVGQGV
ncbi:glycosyltransferase involved in cell wall biosynthesis [Actinoalloteichus hoggarensis]|uniref:D-inositol 3-phosphate glycosyltransferase n=1 Tax=Actinoalloteichus hoggarensis TaxID=1470176 RepID=A0A221W219_9PSEU|nr:glycosyltransferase [Actinoalloteichus hoggarensis]ASO19855.1 D-inositol 3-phosphate glycosyltransferase [Actinoalloteichus hoggarensis]MBB5919436.1 glycosyltransferase involved in cell wall biosynthesis [Actinoalloteichus hoggarensis]